jgi:hypothetical protein
MSQDCPTIPLELLNYLDENYPEQSPDPSWSEREIWMKVGERRVIRNLLMIKKVQDDSLMENSINVHPKSS